MPLATTTLDRFVAAVHRRHVLLRALERTGLCVLVACTACALLIPLLLWQGKSAVAPALWTLAMGGAAGLLWGSLRRPGALEAATEADRQLRLADLLGTALALRRQPASADPWAASVLATAEARCRGLSPSSVILHRLGARAWGGIGLATALVLAVSFLGSSPADTRAARAEGARDPSAPRNVPRDLDRPLVAAGAGSGHRPVPQGAGTDGDAGRPGPSVTGREQATSTQAARQGGTPESRAGTGDTTGGASGSSTTGRRDPAPPESPSPMAGTEATGGTDPAAPQAGGAGRAGLPAGSPSATDPAAGTHAGTAAGPRPATPAWRAPGFDSGARRAREALDAGQVPAAYRDIVRKYFERP